MRQTGTLSCCGLPMHTNLQMHRSTKFSFFSLAHTQAISRPPQSLHRVQVFQHTTLFRRQFGYGQDSFEEQTYSVMLVTRTFVFHRDNIENTTTNVLDLTLFLRKETRYYLTDHRSLDVQQSIPQQSVITNASRQSKDVTIS